MATTIVTKSGSGAPTASDLVAGELAVDLTNKRLYTEDLGGTVLEVGSNPYNFTANHDGSAKLATTATGIDVTGTVTADGLTVSSDTNGDPVLAHLYNTSTGASAEATAYITNSATSSDGLFLQATGDSFTTIGGFVQDAAVLGSGTGSSGGLSIMTRANADMRFYTNGHTNERMRIDSSGNTTFKTSAGHLSVEALGGGSVKLNSNGSMGMNVASGFSYEIDVGGSEVMRIDAAGNVGIGTSSITSVSGYTSLEINNATSGALLDLSQGDSMRGRLIATATTMSLETSGSIPIIFQPAGTERLRIDASGNLIVGKSSLNIGVVGQELRTGGSSYITTSSDTALGLNRLSTDGTVLEIRKDSTVVGSIGSEGGDSLYIQGGTTGGAGLHFKNNTGDIRPLRNGATIDATINLGSDTRRFKDLYLSGGVYLGGTGAANKLDDYESGAFVPTVTSADGNMSGISYVSQAGYYQKIGDLVWFRIQVGFSATTIGTGNFRVTGLPYVSRNDSSARQQATVLTYNLDWDPIWKQIHTEGVQNTNSIDFLIGRDNAVWAGLQADDMANGITYYYIISGCYVTN